VFYLSYDLSQNRRDKGTYLRLMFMFQQHDWDRAFIMHIVRQIKYYPHDTATSTGKNVFSYETSTQSWIQKCGRGRHIGAFLLLKLANSATKSP
jgi:hypothetical protein